MGGRVGLGGPESQVPASRVDGVGKGGWEGAVQSQERKGGSKHGTLICELAGRRDHRVSRKRGPGHSMQGRDGSGAHRHLLVGFHAIQHHLDDLPTQLDTLL